MKLHGNAGTCPHSRRLAVERVEGEGWTLARAAAAAGASVRTLQGRPPVSDVFGKAGRAWLAALDLGLDERETVDAGLRQFDLLQAELAHIDRAIAEQALGSVEDPVADDDPRRRRDDASRSRATGASRKRARRRPGMCSSRRPGRARKRRDRCAPSPTAPPPDAAATSPRSPSHASWPCSPGTS
jgi:hypothetical protein